MLGTLFLSGVLLRWVALDVAFSRGSDQQCFVDQDHTVDVFVKAVWGSQVQHGSTCQRTWLRQGQRGGTRDRQNSAVGYQ